MFCAEFGAQDKKIKKTCRETSTECEAFLTALPFYNFGFGTIKGFRKSGRKGGGLHGGWDNRAPEEVEDHYRGKRCPPHNCLLSCFEHIILHLRSLFHFLLRSGSNSALHGRFAPLDSTERAEEIVLHSLISVIQVNY